MKISVIIPSRGRVRSLSGMLYSMRILESGKHDITYGIACDADDEATIRFCEEMQGKIPLSYNVGAGRPQSLGGLVDHMANNMPADVYTALGDDLLCITPYWDEVIARAVEAVPYGVFWWKNAFPEEVTCAVVTEKWRAAAGSIFTNSYPFWFDDLCLLETWMMATDREAIVLDCAIADKPQHTYRMRDLWFWREFFTATREQRVVAAHEIAKKLGLQEPRLAAHLAAKITGTLERMPKECIEQIERNQGEVDVPPDANYIMAKYRAEQVLASLGKEVRNAA